MIQMTKQYISYIPKYELLGRYEGRSKQMEQPIFQYADLQDRYGRIDRIFLYNMNRMPYMPLKMEYVLPKKQPIKQKIMVSYELEDQDLQNGILFCKGSYLIEVIRDLPQKGE